MEREFRVNDFVWAKMRGYPAWPARVDKHPRGMQGPSNKHYVFFYGTHQYAWMSPSDLFPYFEYKDTLLKPCQRKGYGEAVWEIEEDPLLKISSTVKTPKGKLPAKKPAAKPPAPPISPTKPSRKRKTPVSPHTPTPLHLPSSVKKERLDAVEEGESPLPVRQRGDNDDGDSRQPSVPIDQTSPHNPSVSPPPAVSGTKSLVQESLSLPTAGDTLSLPINSDAVSLPTNGDAFSLPTMPITGDTETESGLATLPPQSPTPSGPMSSDTLSSAVKSPLASSKPKSPSPTRAESPTPTRAESPTPSRAKSPTPSEPKSPVSEPKAEVLSGQSKTPASSKPKSLGPKSPPVAVEPDSPALQSPPPGQIQHRYATRRRNTPGIVEELRQSYMARKEQLPLSSPIRGIPPSRKITSSPIKSPPTTSNFKLSLTKTPPTNKALRGKQSSKKATTRQQSTRVTRRSLRFQGNEKKEKTECVEATPKESSDKNGLESVPASNEPIPVQQDADSAPTEPKPTSSSQETTARESSSVPADTPPPSISDATPPSVPDATPPPSGGVNVRQGSVKAKSTSAPRSRRRGQSSGAVGSRSSTRLKVKKEMVKASAGGGVVTPQKNEVAMETEPESAKAAVTIGEADLVMKDSRGVEPVPMIVGDTEQSGSVSTVVAGGAEKDGDGVDAVKEVTGPQSEQTTTELTTMDTEHTGSGQSSVPTTIGVAQESTNVGVAQQVSMETTTTVGVAQQVSMETASVGTGIQTSMETNSPVETGATPPEEGKGEKVGPVADAPPTNQEFPEEMDLLVESTVAGKSLDPQSVTTQTINDGGLSPVGSKDVPDSPSTTDEPADSAVKVKDQDELKNNDSQVKGEVKGQAKTSPKSLRPKRRIKNANTSEDSPLKKFKVSEPAGKSRLRTRQGGSGKGSSSQQAKDTGENDKTDPQSESTSVPTSGKESSEVMNTSGKGSSEEKVTSGESSKAEGTLGNGAEVGAGPEKEGVAKQQVQSEDEDKDTVRVSTLPDLPPFITPQPGMSAIQVLQTYNYNLKAALTVEAPNTPRALETLKKLKDCSCTASDIDKVSDIIATIKKLKRYRACPQVVEGAEEVYQKFKRIFLFPQQASKKKVKSTSRMPKKAPGIMIDYIKAHNDLVNKPRSKKTGVTNVVTKHKPTAKQVKAANTPVVPDKPVRQDEPGKQDKPDGAANQDEPVKQDEQDQVVAEDTDGHNTTKTEQPPTRTSSRSTQKVSYVEACPDSSASDGELNTNDQIVPS